MLSFGIQLAVIDYNDPDRLIGQQLRGGCTRASGVGFGPAQPGQAGTLTRFRCTQADMWSRALHPDRLTVDFRTKGAAQALSVTFAGVVAPDKRSMSVESVSFLSGGNNYSSKVPAEAGCQFTY